jgi:hypothetical protein
MLTRGALVLFVALLSGACGSSPTSPSAPPVVTPPVTPSSYTVAGTVTATNGGQALSGLTVDLNGQHATTDGAGGFGFPLTSGSTARLLLSGSGIVPRALTLNVGAARTLAVGAISLSSGFDLGFYREFVRNGFEGGNEPLRRWTRAPQVYLRTVDDSGAAIDGQTLDATQRAMAEAMPQWSGYAAAVTRGTESHVGQAGWLTVVWRADASQAICGTSDVGLDGGQMQLFYRRGGGCRCPGGPEITPRTVKHELGHAMGFYHTDNAGDIMAPGVPGCDASPSAREIAHAAIAYARPVGNLDPDSDPTSLVNLAPMRVR